MSLSSKGIASAQLIGYMLCSGICLILEYQGLYFRFFWAEPKFCGNPSFHISDCISDFTQAGPKFCVNLVFTYARNWSFPI